MMPYCHTLLSHAPCLLLPLPGRSPHTWAGAETCAPWACWLQACNLVGKPAILTRVVDTMVASPRPTRAEATDVANAVLDGVDGIMLGAETLRGADVCWPGHALTSCMQAEHCVHGGQRTCWQGLLCLVMWETIIVVVSDGERGVATCCIGRSCCCVAFALPACSRGTADAGSCCHCCLDCY